MKVKLYNKRTKEFIERIIKPQMLSYSNELKLADTFWSNTQKFNCSSPSEVPEEWVMLLFTGLIDKKGKEICEGDIVIAHMLDCHFRGEVIFDSGAFCIKIIKTDNKEYDLCQTPELNNFDYIKIEGNKYENPNLLTQADSTESVS